MLIFVACIDVIITLITLILLLFIIEIIIPINVILMTIIIIIIINACYRFDQWFTYCLSITLQHEINYSLRKNTVVWIILTLRPKSGILQTASEQ